MEQSNESTKYCYLGGRLVKATPMTYEHYSGSDTHGEGCFDEHGFYVEPVRECYTSEEGARWFPKAAVERFAQWVVPRA